MNRIIVFLIFSMLVLSGKAQQSAVDRIFEKYSGKEGYTSVFISKYMFSMFSEVDPDNKEFTDLVNRLNSIRILAIDETTGSTGVNFYTEIMKELSVKEYKELMVIKEKDQDMKFLVRDINGRIVELLLIIGGSKDNALICIQGENINLKNIAKLSSAMKIEGLENLEKINSK